MIHSFISLNHCFIHLFISLNHWFIHLFHLLIDSFNRSFHLKQCNTLLLTLLTTKLWNVITVEKSSEGERKFASFDLRINSSFGISVEGWLAGPENPFLFHVHVLHLQKQSHDYQPQLFSNPLVAPPQYQSHLQKKNKWIFNWTL